MAPILEALQVSKRFGGLQALDAVNLAFEPGRLYAIIGPNGAGKTTFFNVVTGLLPPTSGRIRFAGIDITDAPAHRISRSGLARTMQIKSVFGGMSVAENLWIATQSRRGVFNPFRRYTAFKEPAAKVAQLLDELELGALAEQRADTLSYGHLALLEIGIALATEPRLLLLDEPICGMGPEEIHQTVGKIRQLAKSIDIIIIEHNIEVVFDLADEIVVMAQGAVLARGSPEVISADARVREAYLGEEVEDDA